MAARAALILLATRLRCPQALHPPLPPHSLLLIACRSNISSARWLSSRIFRPLLGAALRSRLPPLPFPRHLPMHLPRRTMRVVPRHRPARGWRLASAGAIRRCGFRRSLPLRFRLMAASLAFRFHRRCRRHWHRLEAASGVEGLPLCPPSRPSARPRQAAICCRRSASSSHPHRLHVPLPRHHGSPHLPRLWAPTPPLQLYRCRAQRCRLRACATSTHGTPLRARRRCILPATAAILASCGSSSPLGPTRTSSMGPTRRQQTRRADVECYRRLRPLLLGTTMGRMGILSSAARWPTKKGHRTEFAHLPMTTTMRRWRGGPRLTLHLAPHSACL